MTTPKLEPWHCRASRAALKLSIGELSTKSDINAGTIVDFEGGRRRTGNGIRLALKDAFQRSGIIFKEDGAMKLQAELGEAPYVQPGPEAGMAVFVEEGCPVCFQRETRLRRLSGKAGDHDHFRCQACGDHWLSGTLLNNVSPEEREFVREAQSGRMYKIDALSEAKPILRRPMGTYEVVSREHIGQLLYDISTQSASRGTSHDILKKIDLDSHLAGLLMAAMPGALKEPTQADFARFLHSLTGRKFPYSSAIMAVETEDGVCEPITMTIWIIRESKP